MFTRDSGGPVEIAETSVFTRQVQGLLDRESYRLLQLELTDRPDRGAIIPGSGGLRKLRWEGSGRGKRGGTRVIYYWVRERDLILLLLIYSKADQADLTPMQLKMLRRVVEEEIG
jgi:mRNA-degrading endonuclease RelE of RelBE toxin-antitoxin system